VDSEEMGSVPRDTGENRETAALPRPKTMVPSTDTKLGRCETSALCVPAEVRILGERPQYCVPRLDLSALWTEGPGAPCPEAGDPALSTRVREWLADLGLSACVPAFAAAGVSAESLLELSEAGEEKLKLLGVAQLDDRIRLRERARSSYDEMEREIARLMGVPLPSDEPNSTPAMKQVSAYMWAAAEEDDKIAHKSLSEVSLIYHAR
jgi:uncharacterized small protein (DUF1192 family)